jgi:hypothetical protein
VRLNEKKVLSNRFDPEELIGPDISKKELENCLFMDNTYAFSYKGISHPEVSGIQFSAAYHNPTLILTPKEYYKFYNTLNHLLQGGIYLLDGNGKSKKSNLVEVWKTLDSYEYIFDGKETRLYIKR